MSSAALGICLIVTARATDVSDFGVYMTAYAAGLVVGLVAGLGAPIRVLRSPAESQPLHGALYAVHLTLVVLAHALLAGLYLALHPTAAALAGVLFALGDALQNYAQGQLTSLNHQVAANVLVLLHRLVPLATVCVMFATTGRVQYWAVGVSFLVPIALGVVVPLRGAVQAGIRPLRRAFTGWVGYWAYACAATVTQLQLPLLSLVASAAVVGQFSMSNKVVGPITLFTASLAAIVVPELARLTATPAQFDHLFRRLRVVCMGYCALVVVAAYPVAVVITSMAGAQYHSARLLVVGAVVGAALSAWSQSYNAKLLAVGRPGSATWALLIGAAVALAIICLLGWGEAERTLWLVPVASQAVVLAIMVRVSRA